MESEYNSVRRGTALRGKKRGAHAVHRNGGSTGVLKLRDDCGSVWYDGENSRRRLGEDTFYLPWEYMPQSDGRIYHEGTGKARRRRG